MKLAVIAVILLAGTISAQMPRSNVDTCVRTVKTDITLVQKLVNDVKNHEQYQIIADIMEAYPQLEKTKTACVGLDVKEIMSYVYEHMSQSQRDCLTEVLGVVFSAQTIIEDVKTKNWSELVSDLEIIASSVEGVQKKCSASLLREFQF